MEKFHRRTFITKEAHKDNGAGISIVSSIKELDQLLNTIKNKAKSKQYKYLIVQKYLTNPLLTLDQKKFDLRIYFLIASIDPLIVLYHDGYLRVALDAYNSNINDTNKRGHLTNAKIQKDHNMYVYNPIYTFVELEKMKENQKNTDTVIGTNPVPAKIIQGEDGYFYPSNRSKNVRTILDNDFEHPSIFDPPIFPDTFSNRNKRALFAIGAAGSGVYFHKHSSTWRALVYGKTKWYLYPPGSYPGGSSFGSMNDFLKRRLENVTIQEDIEFESIQPLEIVQNEGEILYIPDLWQHATVNLQFSIGIAFEIGFYRDVEY